LLHEPYFQFSTCPRNSAALRRFSKKNWVGYCPAYIVLLVFYVRKVATRGVRLNIQNVSIETQIDKNVLKVNNLLLITTANEIIKPPDIQG
jgi:hypothetical protein